MAFLRPDKSKSNLLTLVCVILGGFAGIGILMVAYPQGPHFFTPAEAKYWNYTDSSILVIKPLLTANAYKKGGFYDYYKGTCDESCLSVQIDKNIQYTYDSSLRAIVRFEALNATMADDYTVNPKTLKNYDRIILLHSEYVTQEFFDAITSHPNVIYLYPNALYGKVEVKDGIMKLVQGHGYKGMDNGFGWKFDDTRPYEMDNTCDYFKWMNVDNGMQLNCYPENFLMNNTWVFGHVRDVTKTNHI